MSCSPENPWRIQDRQQQGVVVPGAETECPELWTPTQRSRAVPVQNRLMMRECIRSELIDTAAKFQKKCQEGIQAW